MKKKYESDKINTKIGTNTFVAGRVLFARLYSIHPEQRCKFATKNLITCTGPGPCVLSERSNMRFMMGAGLTKEERSVLNEVQRFCQDYFSVIVFNVLDGFILLQALEWLGNLKDVC